MSIGTATFYDCTSLTSITIPNSVTSIGNYAFRGCQSLASIKISNSLTSIGNYAFNGCRGLTSITLPSSVTSIGMGAFQGCTGLTSITIPNSVTSIEEKTFYGCKRLIVINIGKDVQSIGNMAFANVGKSAGARTRSEASTIVVNCYTESVPYTASDAFENTPIETGELFVEDDLVNSYKSTSPWSGFGKIIGLDEAAGIDSITIGTEDAWIFDTQGNRLDNARKGVNILRTKDGKTKKIVMK